MHGACVGANGRRGGDGGRAEVRMCRACRTWCSQRQRRIRRRRGRWEWGNVVAQGVSLLVLANGDMALARSMGEPRPMEMRVSIRLYVDGGEGAKSCLTCLTRGVLVAREEPVATKAWPFAV